MGVPIIGTIIEAGAAVIDKVTGLLDVVTTSDEERDEAKAKLQGILNSYNEAVLKAEGELINAQRDVLIAELQGKSWMQRNWRPSLMYVFMGVIVNQYVLVPYFSWARVIEVPAPMWGLMTLAVGGYVGGRTMEKLKGKSADA